MNIRKYHPDDCAKMARLFYDTVHTVCKKDYTEKQLAAWATGTVDMIAWNRSFLQNTSLVVTADDGALLAFGDMDDTGYLDRLYVHKDHQNEGIATKIVAQLEKSAADRGTQMMTTYASLTAKNFFEARGYQVTQAHTALCGGESLSNFRMQKRLYGND